MWLKTDMTHHLQCTTPTINEAWWWQQHTVGDACTGRMLGIDGKENLLDLLKIFQTGEVLLLAGRQTGGQLVPIYVQQSSGNRQGIPTQPYTHKLVPKVNVEMSITLITVKCGS